MFLSVIVLCALIFKAIHRSLQDNLKVDIFSCDVYSPAVEQHINDYCYDFVKYRFEKILRPIYTQRGHYRTDYLREVEKQKKCVYEQCCEGNSFASSFCDFIEQEYPKGIRYKDIYEAVCNYSELVKTRQESAIDGFMKNIREITPAQFFKIKNEMKGDAVGVYIIYNATKDLYYVGQSKKLLFRVYQHFTGHGNGDVYADYKYGDEFTIRIVTMALSGYVDIDKLEKDLIKKYNAFENGYNKTVGNS